MIALLMSLLLLVQPIAIAPQPPEPAIAQAQTMPPQQAIERLFTAPDIQPDWFAPSFLQQVAPAQIRAVITDITQDLGEFQAVRAIDRRYEVQFQRGVVPTQISLDAQGRIAGLLFQPPAVAIAPDEAAAAIQASPYPASLLILQNGTELAAVDADQPLAVGSAFKLAVLAALQDQIQQGRLSWDTVVELQPEWKSLPSGMLHDWPDGSALTLDTLATLTISISDNTATDALIQIVGREAVEAIAPRNRPFLTTQEAFILKNPANQEWLERYRRANVAEQRRLLDRIAGLPLPEASLFLGDPLSPDIEWFFTARELCQLMDQVAPLPLMQINPGVADPLDWQQIAFKGGSEPGVFNMTTWLQNDAGQTYCVVTTWNAADQALDEAALAQFHRGVISALH